MKVYLPTISQVPNKVPQAKAHIYATHDHKEYAYYGSRNVKCNKAAKVFELIGKILVVVLGFGLPMGLPCVQKWIQKTLKELKQGYVTQNYYVLHTPPAVIAPKKPRAPQLSEPTPAPKEQKKNAPLQDIMNPLKFSENAIHISMKLVNCHEIHDYTGDLTDDQRLKMNIELILEGPSQKVYFHYNFSETKVSIRLQDIFKSGAQVIVNAANTHLGGGGGIDGAIHSKGGQEYAQQHANLQKTFKSEYVSGYASMIGSGQLKDQYGIENVIVVAGPQDESTPEKESQLYSCYFNSLTAAHLAGKSSIAFPSISTGIFGFPKDRAAAISLKAIYDFLQKFPDTPLKSISIHFLPSQETKAFTPYTKQMGYEIQ